jgi:hypothetical protein
MSDKKEQWELGGVEFMIAVRLECRLIDLAANR